MQDQQAALLRATDSELECLIAGYLLSDESKRTAKELHAHGRTLVGMERMPASANAIRHYIDVRMNPAAPLAPFVARVEDPEVSYRLNDAGADLQLLARYRLAHSLERKVAISALFSERADPLAICRYLAHADSREGVKTVHELAETSGLSLKSSRAILHGLVAWGLAERAEVKNGHGIRLALNSNGPLSAYMRGFRLMMAFLQHPDDEAIRAQVYWGTLAPEQLLPRIREYEASTQHGWGADYLRLSNP